MEVGPIASMTNDLWKFRILVAAIRLGVFDILENVNEAGKAADNLEVDHDALQRLLNALVAMGFLDKKDDSYSNKPITSKFLVKSSKEYYGDYVLMNEESDSSWKELDKVIRNGPPEDRRERLTREVFTRAMHNNAQAPAKALAGMIDFSKRKHLLDIGGGSGAFSIILTNRFKNLKATVIDQPTVCKAMKGYIEKEGDSSRIDIVEGDYFDVEFPVHDVALFGQIFHSNSPVQNRHLLKKVFERMEDKGVVIITEFLMDEGRTSPLFPVLFNLNMLKQAKGAKAYTFSEIRSMLEDAGFRDAEKMSLAGPHTAIIAYK